jgi:hypothetical protein
MPKLGTEEMQSAVEDSILGDDSNIVATYTHEGNFANLAEGFSDAEDGESVFEDSSAMIQEQIEEDDPEGVGLRAVLKHGDEAVANRMAEREAAQPRNNAESTMQAQRVTKGNTARPELEAQEQPPEVTPQSVQEWAERTEATIQEHGLNDPQTARGFADEFCAALGTDVYRAGIDVQALGSTMAKTALSALSVYDAAQGNPESIPQVAPAAAKAFSHDILRGLGMDPRTVQGVNEQLLADTVLRGVLNFYDTYQRHGGKVADVSRLNDAEAAELFLGNFMQALGATQPASRQTALKVADALGNYLLGFIGKINQTNQRQAEARQGQGGRSNTGRGRGQRVPQRFKEGLKGSKAPRFSTNDDIFSGPAVQAAMSQKL